VNERNPPYTRHVEYERMASEYGASMLKFAAAQLGGRQLAEDAVQEALIKLFVHSEKYIGTQFERSYVMRTVLNACRDIQRSAWYRKVSPTIGDAAAHSGEAYEEKSPLLESIGQLKPPLREALLARYYLGFDTRETARMLGVSEGVVRERIRQAKSRLPALMKESEALNEY
jgi:RNA polymerase sigma-70 factor, ECF subfamily